MFGLPKSGKIENLMDERRKQKSMVNGGAEDDEAVELEKGDFLAMMIAAYITLLPAILIPIGIVFAITLLFS